ncbi:hypothetical protein FA13DRAFT_1739148, partial [Coprinellus micaceus]
VRRYRELCLELATLLQHNIFCRSKNSLSQAGSFNPPSGQPKYPRAMLQNNPTSVSSFPLKKDLAQHRAK